MQVQERNVDMENRDMTLKIGSRESELAVAQANLVIQALKKQYPNMQVELLTWKTTGDKILNKTLDKIGGKGLFVKELDQALMDGKIDLAVHSLKDVPMEENPQLPLVAFPKRADARDVLVLPKKWTKKCTETNKEMTEKQRQEKLIKELIEEKSQEEMQETNKKNCEERMRRLHCIGTSSFRRRIQIKALYPQAEIQSVRGNLRTRLEKLDNGEYDALILAAAGLLRNGWGERICRYFDPSEVLPAAGQGILGVQARADFPKELLAGIQDADTAAAALAERGFVRYLNGGCSSPVAAYARVNGYEMELRGLYYKEEEDTYVIERLVGEKKDAAGLGARLAEQMQKKYQ